MSWRAVRTRKAGKDGRWFDILVPANDETKRDIEEKILEAYEKEGDGA